MSGTKANKGNAPSLRKFYSGGVGWHSGQFKERRCPYCRKQNVLHTLRLENYETAKGVVPFAFVGVCASCNGHVVTEEEWIRLWGQASQGTQWLDDEPGHGYEEDGRPIIKRRGAYYLQHPVSGVVVLLKSLNGEDALKEAREICRASGIVGEATALLIHARSRTTFCI
jgi:hypothetical protein